MRQIAVFVDAGYLYAQGSALLAGTRQQRPQIKLSIDDVVGCLKNLANEAANDARLLRIYWYDGLQRGGRLSTEQSAIAHASDVKLRLGMVNGSGEQKGVDSLIVTDMIDLARNGAISDAVIVSGDEDIRVGVQVAQTYGVRVHLVGIEPARGSQSPDLLREADTCHELNSAEVAQWMTIMPDRAEALPLDMPAELPLATAGTEAMAAEEVIGRTVRETVEALPIDEIVRAVGHIRENRNLIPPEIDRPTLARVSASLGRKLEEDERRDLRGALRRALEARALNPQ